MRKRNVMRAFAILGVLLVVALVASPAIGASDKPPDIKSMKISVWPEYDDTRVMVTYQGEFKDGSTFPQLVNFPAPLGSEINMACALQPPSDEHLCQLYDTQTGPDDLTISYTLPIPTYYMEYYWDGIKGQSEKSFTFKYVSPYAIDSLELEVQQPLKATDFNLAQSYASATSDGQGFKYYHYVFNNVTPGQVISVDASYTKPDNKPSVAKTTSGAGTGGSAGSVGGSNPYVLMGIGAALLTVVAFGFIFLRRKPVTAPVRPAPVLSRKAARVEARRIQAQQRGRHEIPRPQRPETTRATETPSQARGSEAAFCSQCGAKLAAGSHFCHVCGARAKGTA